MDNFKSRNFYKYDIDRWLDLKEVMLEKLENNIKKVENHTERPLLEKF